MQFAVEHSRSQTPVGRPVVRQLSFPDGTPWTEFYRIPGGILLRFPGLADYEVSADGLKIRCFPEAEVSAATVDHLYANQVLPLALSRLGKIVIHAAAVETGGKGIAFVGESGLGKSTLAASFATSGLRLLADDNLVIENIGADYRIQPGLPVIRLWDDSHKALVWDSTPRDSGIPHTSKARFLAGEQIGYCDQPCLLRYAYLLGGETTGPAEFEPLAPADLFARQESGFSCRVFRVSRRGIPDQRLVAIVPESDGRIPIVGSDVLDYEVVVREKPEPAGGGDPHSVDFPGRTRRRTRSPSPVSTAAA